MMQLFGQLPCYGERRRNHDDALRLCFQNLFRHLTERILIGALVKSDFYVDMEIAAHLFTLLCTFLNLFPVSFRFVLRDEQIEGVRFVVRQCTGVHVGLVIHLLQRLLHLFTGSLGYVGALMEDSVNRSDGYASSFSNILDPDFFGHCFKYLF